MRRTPRRRRAVPRLLGACVLAAAAAAAAAPAEVAPAPLAPGGRGLRLGDNDGRLHPYVDLDTHWVHNPGRLPRDSVEDLAHTARAGFDLDLPSPTLALSGDGHLAYVRYWGVQTPATRALSAAAGRLDLSAVLHREGPVTWRLHGQVVRSADPANQTITARLLHTAGTAALGVDVRPGGGALVLTAGYGVFYDRYDRADNGLLAPAALDNLRHMPELRLAWKFLPKTALFAEAQMALTRFAAVPLFGTEQTNVDSGMLAAYAGLAGNVTRRLTTVVKAGYGNTLLAHGAANLQAWIGQAELILLASEQLHVHLGVQRSIAPTSLFQYFLLSGGFVALEAHLATGTALTLRPAISDLRYGPSLVALTCDASVGQRLTAWLTISLVERVDWRRSDFVTPVGNAGYLFNDLRVRLDARY